MSTHTGEQTFYGACDHAPSPRPRLFDMDLDR